MDLLQVLPGLGLVDRLEKHLGVTGDRRQEVVEVVGDPSGQATHRLHLLGLEELLLELLALGHVQEEAEDLPAPLRRGHQGLLVLDPPVLPVRMPETIVPGGAPLLLQPLHGGVQHLPVLGVDPIQPQLGSVDERLGGIPQDGSHVRAHVGRASPDPGRGGVDHRGPVGQDPAQALLGRKMVEQRLHLVSSGGSDPLWFPWHLRETGVRSCPPFSRPRGGLQEADPAYP